VVRQIDIGLTLALWPIRRPIEQDLNLLHAAFPASEAPCLRQIYECDARGRAEGVERHDSMALAGAV